MTNPRENQLGAIFSSVSQETATGCLRRHSRRYMNSIKIFRSAIGQCVDHLPRINYSDNFSKDALDMQIQSVCGSSEVEKEKAKCAVRRDGLLSGRVCPHPM